MAMLACPLPLNSCYRGRILPKRIAFKGHAFPHPILLVTRNFPPTRGGIETLAAERVKHGLAIGEPLVLAYMGQPACAEPPAGLIAYHHLPGTGRWPSLSFLALGHGGGSLLYARLFRLLRVCVPRWP